MFALSVSPWEAGVSEAVIRLATVDRRLVPLNAFIGLCTSDHLWPAPLADLGYSIRGLEIPVGAGGGRVVIDAVAFRDDNRAFLAAEAKSGKNVEVDQARAYEQIQADDLVRASRVTVTTGGSVTYQPVYVCLEENAERILLGLAKATAGIPVVSLDGDIVASRGAGFADPDVEATFRKPTRFPGGAVPRYITVDVESPTEEYDREVLAALVVEMSHRRPQIEMPVLAHNAFRYLAMFGEATKGRIIDLVDGAARRIAEADPESFRYSPRTGTRSVAVIEFLRSPEDADLRGRTQSYQAVSRAAGKKPIRRREVEGQQSIDDLVAELDQSSEPIDTEDEIDD